MSAADAGRADGLRGPIPSGVPLHAAWVKPALGLLSPAGQRARLTILIFHRVHREPDPMFPNEMHADSFRERMTWIRNWFDVLPLSDAVQALRADRLPARALCITFDDGYADNCTVALPILKELGLPATFFIATGYLDGGRMWNDTIIEAVRAAPAGMLDLREHGMGSHEVSTPATRAAVATSLIGQLKHLMPDERQNRVGLVEAAIARALPGQLMMSRDQLRSLAAAGMGIGAHTRTHPILARIDGQAARREIGDGRDELEGIVRQPVSLFAYPNGKPDADYRKEHVSLVRDLGFLAAVSTEWGAATSGDDLFELPRFTPWDRTAPRWGVRLLQNLRTRAVGARQ